MPRAKMPQTPMTSRHAAVTTSATRDGVAVSDQGRVRRRGTSRAAESELTGKRWPVERPKAMGYQSLHPGAIRFAGHLRRCWHWPDQGANRLAAAAQIEGLEVRPVSVLTEMPLRVSVEKA
jgi:hypothetical protein